MHIHTDQILYGHSTTTEPTDRFALHCHPMYECFYFIGGEVRYLVEGVPYSPTPHSMLLMAAGVFHGIQIVSDAPYERLTLHFDAACLPGEMRETLLRPFHAGAVYYEQVDAHRIQAYLLDVEACAAMDEALQPVALAVRTAALLTQICHLATLRDPAALPTTEARALDRQIVAYINVHLTEPLTLDGIAQHFFLSRNQLCRSFLQATGTTVGTYLRQKRLALAQQLRASGQSAGEAAANAGFADYSTYYRTHCKLLGRAPTAGEGGSAFLA